MGWGKWFRSKDEPEAKTKNACYDTVDKLEETVNFVFSHQGKCEENNGDSEENNENGENEKFLVGPFAQNAGGTTRFVFAAACGVAMMLAGVAAIGLRWQRSGR